MINVKIKEEIKVKPCPICKIGKLRLVHYAKPMRFDPDDWEETEDCLYEPIMTYKKVECGNCGAITAGWRIKVEEAIKDWNLEDHEGNRGMVVQYYLSEDLKVEGK